MTSGLPEYADGSPPIVVGAPLTGRDLVTIRSLIEAQARHWGLSEDTGRALQIVATELATNIVVHAQGCGHLRLSQQRGFLYCQAVDHGPGIARSARAGWQAPASGDPLAVRGLWMVRILCARLHIDSSRLGTTITAVIPVN